MCKKLVCEPEPGGGSLWSVHQRPIAAGGPVRGCQAGWPVPCSHRAGHPRLRDPLSLRIGGHCVCSVASRRRRHVCGGRTVSRPSPKAPRGRPDAQDPLMRPQAQRGAAGGARSLGRPQSNVTGVLIRRKCRDRDTQRDRQVRTPLADPWVWDSRPQDGERTVSILQAARLGPVWGLSFRGLAHASSQPHFSAVGEPGGNLGRRDPSAW